MLRTLTLALNTRSRLARIGLGLALAGALATAALAPQSADAAYKGGPVTGGPICCIYQPYPDLVVSEYRVGAHVKIRNRGDDAAPPSTLAVSGVGNWAIPTLGAGATYTVQMPIMRCTESTWTARADAFNVVHESNESNNARSVTVLC